MELLQELWASTKRRNQEDQEEDNLLGDETGEEDLLDDTGGEDTGEEDMGEEGDLEPNPEEGQDFDPEDDQELDQVAGKATENPDRQGVLRAVKGAHLVYKRETEDGTYEELWVFNGGDSVSKNLDTRKAILAGTDIPTNKTASPDGKQQYTLWTAGNAELLNIVGLPN